MAAEGFMDWVSGLGGEIVRWHEDGEWHERRFEVCHYTATELDRALCRAGFASVDIDGDFDRGPLGRDARLIAVARTT